MPLIKADLTSSEIDLADFKGLFGAKPQGSTTPPPPNPDNLVIPDTKLAVKKLPGVDITLNFDGKRIRAAGGLPFDEVIFGVRIANGTLTIDPLNFRVGLGVLFPPAAILPLADLGLGPNNACHTAYEAQNPPGNAAPKSGSSMPPAPARPVPPASAPAAPPPGR